jgi:hypothetical protein
VNNGLRHAPTDFPRAAERQGYEWLSECVKRYDVVDDIMAVLVSDQYVPLQYFGRKRYQQCTTWGSSACSITLQPHWREALRSTPQSLTPSTHLGLELELSAWNVRDRACIDELC